MATQARGAFGTLLQRDDGTGTFVTIAEVMDINGPAISHVIEDATNMDSPSGWAEKVAVGVKEAGDVTFQVHTIHSNATQDGLRSDLVAGTARNYRVIFPGGAQRLAFAGIVSNIGNAYPVRGKLMNDVTIAVTGPVVKEAHP